MADDHDRDRRRARTPPRGVRQQTAPETWDGDVTPLPSDPREALEKVDRRIKQSGTQTVDRVDAVRTELHADIRGVMSKVDGLVASLMSVSSQTAEMAGQVKILVGDREVDRQERSVLRAETVRAELEIRKTTELAEVDERKKSGEHRRAVALKVLAGIAVAWGTLSAALLSRGCGPRGTRVGDESTRSGSPVYDRAPQGSHAEDRPRQ